MGDFLSGLGDFIDTATSGAADILKALNAPPQVTVPGTTTTKPATAPAGGIGPPAQSSSPVGNTVLLVAAVVGATIFLPKILR